MSPESNPSIVRKPVSLSGAIHMINEALRRHPDDIARALHGPWWAKWSSPYWPNGALSLSEVADPNTQRLLVETVTLLTNSLTPWQYKVSAARFSLLQDGPPQTLEVVARQQDVCRGAVRQAAESAIWSAMGNLRHKRCEILNHWDHNQRVAAILDSLR